MTRACYQFGSLTRKKRAKGPDAWEFRYYESTAQGMRNRKTATVGTVEQFKTKALAKKAVEALLLKLNAETPRQRIAEVTFGAICDRYLLEELPERYSTAKSYRSNIKNYLKPRWGRLSARKDPANGCRGLAEKSAAGSEVKDARSERDAPDVRVRHTVGTFQ